MEHDIIYLKIELSQKWQKYDLVRFYSKRLEWRGQTCRHQQLYTVDGGKHHLQMAGDLCWWAAAYRTALQ